MRVAAAVTRLISSAAGTLATTDDGAAVSRSHVSVRRRLSATIPLPIRCCSTVHDPRPAGDRGERGREPGRIDVVGPTGHHQLAHVIAPRPGSGGDHSPGDRCPIGQPWTPVSRWSTAVRAAYARGTSTSVHRRSTRARLVVLGSALVALVVAAVTSAGLPGGGTAQAQANEPAEVISRQPGGGGPLTDFNTDASISADGRFVVFNASVAGPRRLDRLRDDPRPDRRHDVGVRTRRSAVPPRQPERHDQRRRLRDRVLGSTGGRRRPTASSTTAATTSRWSSAFSTPTSTVPGARGVGRRIGDRLVERVQRLRVRSAPGTRTRWSQSCRRRPPAGRSRSFGAKVAISDDGNVIAFTYGRAPARTTRRRRTSTCGTAAHPHRGAGDLAHGGRRSEQRELVRPVDLRRRQPRRVLLVRHRSGGRAATGESSTSSRCSTDRPSTMRLVANDASEPDISRDGRHIAYNLDVGEIGDVYVATSTSPQPFATIATDLVSYSLGRSAEHDVRIGVGPGDLRPRPVGRVPLLRRRSAHQRQSGSPTDGTCTPGNARPVLAVSPIDFGTVQVGNTFDLTSTVSNQGLSGFVITSIAASGGFAVVGENCPDVLHRGQSCTVTVRFSPAAAVDSTGQLTVRDDTYAARAAGVLRRAAGHRIGGGGDDDAPARRPPRPPPRHRSRRRSRWRSTRPPSRSRRRRSGVAAATQMARVRNTGTGSNTVSAVSIGGTNAADFAIVSTNCVRCRARTRRDL